MRSVSRRSWSRTSVLAVSAIGAGPGVALLVTGLGASLVGCEDELEPRAYLGATTTTTYVAPPVYTPGVPTAQPAPTAGLVELPPATVAPCTVGAGLALGSSDTASLGFGELVVLVSAGTARSVSPSSESPGCPNDTSPDQPTFDGIGSPRTLDARGPVLVAGTTAITAVTTAGPNVLCDLPGAKAVARTPGTDTGYAITGSRDVYALDWSGESCVVTPVALATGLPDVLGTLALGTSATSGPWIATAERDTTPGAPSTVIARARRFDASAGIFDELSPALGGQPGTICSIDAIAITDDGERVAIIDGTCGRLVIFRASDGELVGGVSTRAKSVAPVPGQRAFLTVASVADQASFARIDAP